MKTRTTLIAVFSFTLLNAQVQVIENYLSGTRINYYVGECGNEIPEAEGKVNFCDAAGNLAVVENSFGLNSRSVDRMETNFYNNDLIFCTTTGLSIKKEDGTWDNLPNRAAPNEYGDPGQSNKDIREAIYLPDGTIVFHGANLGRQIDFYNPETKELGAYLLDTLISSSNPWAIEYDPDRDLVWILGGSNTNKRLYSLENGVCNEVHDLDAITFGSVLRADYWAYDNDLLWMVNNSGLIKIDLLNDYEETIYNQSDNGLLPFDNIYDMEIDADGMIWLAQTQGTPADGGLTRFNPNDETYVLYQIEDENPGGYNVRFHTLGIDAQGHIWAVTNDYGGLYELELTSSDPIWTLHDDDDFDSMGLPYTYNPEFIHTQNGNTYFTTTSTSSGSSDDFEILVLEENGTWTGINDNEEGNISRRMMASSYSKLLSDPDGGLWWFDQYGDEFMYLRDETDFSFEHNTGYAGPDYCSISTAGTLTMRIGSEIGSYSDGEFTPYESIPGTNFNTTASIGNSVWAWQSQQSSDNMLVRYIDGEVIDSYSLPALSTYYHFTPLSNGQLIFVKSANGEVNTQLFDPSTQEISLLNSAPTSGIIREVIAGDNGDYWVVAALSLIYFDGNGGAPLVLDESNTEMNSLGGTNSSLQDAVLDVDMNLHVIQGSGRIYTISPPYDDLEVEMIQFTGTTGLMPFQSGFQQGYSMIGLDAEGDIWFGKRQNQLYQLQDENSASEYHVDIAVGLSSSLEQNDFSIFPNPGNDFISIKSTESIAFWRMIDVTGKEVLRSRFTMDNRIDVSSLAKGLYQIVLAHENGAAYARAWIKN